MTASTDRAVRSGPRTLGRAARLVALAVALAALPRPGSAEPAPTVRLVTFNLLHGGVRSGWLGDDELESRLQMTVAALRALRPDVVALQEASISRAGGHVARRLAETLGFHYVHARATERVFGLPFLGRLATAVVNFREGPAILSRFPIAASVVHSLPRCRRWLDPRVLLAAELVLPAGRLAVYSTHASRDDCQLRAIEALVTAARGDLPSVVMGDFNAGEGLEAIEHLTGPAGFVDSFRAANPRTPGFTVWQRPGAQEPTVTRRVDYIFLLPGRRVIGTVRRSAVVLDQPGRRADGSLLWPSDHYGVLTELALDGEPTTAGGRAPAVTPSYSRTPRARRRSPGRGRGGCRDHEVGSRMTGGRLGSITPSWSAS